MTITTEQAADLIRGSGGAFFGVTFTKRTTGEVRNMQCRLGVKSYLRGGEPAYNFADHNLISVYDMAKAGYRSVPVDSISQLHLNGQQYEVVPSAKGVA